MFPIDGSLPPDATTVAGYLIRALALKELGQTGPGKAVGAAEIVAEAAERFKITRQAVNGHLRSLVDEGVLVAQGATKGRQYGVYTVVSSQSFPRVGGPSESEVWANYVARKLPGLTHAFQIAQYAFTEIYNNALDHSESTSIFVVVSCSAAVVRLMVSDTGVGIFNKLREMYQYEDERAAVLDLIKGRLTTDPTSHTGWGIFYSSRMCDRFTISSGHTYFSHAPDIDETSDWLIDMADPEPGTRVTMDIDTRPSRTMTSVLDQYTLPGQYGLNVTHVPLNLAQVGQERLVSRSQAKSIAARFDWFDAVVLDFKGVLEIGQAFADELFRVWQRDHPNIRLTPINANDNVLRVIRAALALLAAEQSGNAPRSPGETTGP